MHAIFDALSNLQKIGRTGINQLETMSLCTKGGDRFNHKNINYKITDVDLGTHLTGLSDLTIKKSSPTKDRRKRCPV